MSAAEELSPAKRSALLRSIANRLSGEHPSDRDVQEAVTFVLSSYGSACRIQRGPAGRAFCASAQVAN